MKHVFLIDSLQIGGAEKLLVLFANALASSGHSVVVCSLYDGPLSKRLSKSVSYKSILGIGAGSLFNRSFKRILREIFIKLPRLFIRRHINDADTIVSYVEGHTTYALLNMYTTAIKAFWIHTNLATSALRNKKGIADRIISASDFVFFPSLSCRKSFIDCLSNTNQESKCQVIENALDPTEILELAKSFVPDFADYTLSVGRLVKEKGYFQLLDYLKRLKDSGLDVNHKILGDGPLRYELQSYIAAHGLDDCVILLGATDNPYPYINACSHMILSSEVEGFSLVCLEALILEKPILCRSIDQTISLSAKYKNVYLYSSFSEFSDKFKKLPKSVDVEESVYFSIPAYVSEYIKITCGH